LHIGKDLDIGAARSRRQLNPHESGAMKARGGFPLARRLLKYRNLITFMILDRIDPNHHDLSGNRGCE
jgi:hypothetical protein